MQVIATAGHVDHGKSTLLRLLTGMEPDRWSEERRRGMTIDLGFAWTAPSGGTTLAFVDVPGHERFVPNMLAGIGEIPAVLFVVAADEGWMPQSTEHLQALNALGVRHGVLAVTRSDLTDPGPAMRQARQQLAETSLADLPAVAVSGATGAGVGELARTLQQLAARLPAPDERSDVRLWVDRAFTIKGTGTVVTGTLAAGTLRGGDELALHRDGRTLAVRGLQSLGHDLGEVRATARVAVNLRGARFDELGRGDALVTPRAWLSSDVVDVRLRGSPAAELPRHLMVHAGAAAVSARVRPLGTDTARLSLDRALPLRIGDRCVLRDPGCHRVPAGAAVLDVRPPSLRRRGAGAARAAELESIDDRPDAVAELARRAIVRRDDLTAMGATVPPELPRAGDWLIDPEHRDALAARLLDLLARHRSERPLEDGMPEQAVQRALGLPDPALLAAVLDSPAAKQVSVHEGRVRSGSTGLPEPVRRAVAAIRERLAENPFDAPTADELTELGTDGKQLAAAARAGELLKIDQGIYLLPDALDVATERLAELDDSFTMSQARRALGTSRRVAVPLLEKLAGRRRTRRLPDGTHCLL